MQRNQLLTESVVWLFFACAEPSLVVDLNTPSAPDCPTEWPEPPPAPATCGTNDADVCASNEDCIDGEHGLCNASRWETRCSCEYDVCVSDRDCPIGSMCNCGNAGSVNQCVVVECHVDGDCSNGFCLRDRSACGSVEDANLLWETESHCSTEADTCRSDSACPGLGEFCVFMGDHWGCSHLEYQVTCE